MKETYIELCQQAERSFQIQVVILRGIPSSTARTVSENCTTLRMNDLAFDE